MLRTLFYVLLVLIVPSTRVAAGCIDPATLTHSTVSIMRHRISTAWGQPNVVSVPASVLTDFVPVD